MFSIDRSFACGRIFSNFATKVPQNLLNTCLKQTYKIVRTEFRQMNQYYKLTCSIAPGLASTS